MKFIAALTIAVLAAKPAASQAVDLQCSFDDGTESDVRISREEMKISVGVEEYEIFGENSGSIFAVMFFDPHPDFGAPAQIGSLALNTQNGQMQLASLGSERPWIIVGQCFRPIFD